MRFDVEASERQPEYTGFVEALPRTKVEVIISPDAFEIVRTALLDRCIDMTVTDVRVSEHRGAKTACYRGVAYDVTPAKVKVEMVVPAADADHVLEPFLAMDQAANHIEAVLIHNVVSLAFKGRTSTPHAR
jgi:nitrogen regulatory protein PII